MPAPDKTKKPMKLDKGKKPEAVKKQKKSSGNLMIILSVVGVVVLLAVGITIFFLFSGGEKPIAAVPVKNIGQVARETGDGQAVAPQAAEGATPPPDINEIKTKVNDMIDKLAVAAKKEESAKLLKDMLESDLINKVPGGRNLLLTTVKDKAKAGNEGAVEFLKTLARDSSNAALAQAARKMYDENLRKDGEKDFVTEVTVGEEPTTFIPNKADVVFSIQLTKFLESEYNRGVFTTGAFRQEDVNKRLGMPANTVEQFIVSGIKDFNQVAAIVRTTIPMNWEDVKKAMHLEEAGITIKGKTYYLGKVDFMTEFLSQRIPGIEALRDKAAFWRVDSRTLVYADETTMKDLLENPPEKNKNPDPPPTASPPTASQQRATNLPGAESVDDLNLSASSGGGRAAGGGAAPAAQGKATGALGGGGAPAASGPATSRTTANPGQPTRPERFMTIDPTVRRLIRLTEEAKQDSLVLFADKATSKLPVLVSYVHFLDQLPSTKGKEIDSLALVLPAVTGSPTLRLGVACKSRAVVRDVSAEIEKVLARIGKEDLHDLFGFDFKLNVPQSQTNTRPGSASGGGLTLGGRASQSTGAALGAGGDDDLGTGGRGGGMNAGGMNFGGKGRATPVPGTTPGQSNSSPTDTLEPGQGGAFTVERSDEFIVITATVKSSLADFIDKHMKSWMQQIRGSQEIASGKFRLGDLAASLDYYKNDLVRNNRTISFPQGAYPRSFDAERGSRPYPASERVSFLRELLPYLGDERYFGMHKGIDGIDPERSWRDGSNLSYARILVPHFLNPAVGPNYSYVKVRGVDTPLAVTHFVGMAGVGPDAASLPKTDPRAGIFGYDRVTSPDDVKDGLSNTIFMIEADKNLLGPWLQGGGASVRGTSMAGTDVGRRGGFSSPNFSGKPGVWVLMADGSARYLTKDISPDVFKALCTMAGSDSAGAIDLIATRANLEVTPRTDSASAISTQRKKKIVEEEDVPVKK